MVEPSSTNKPLRAGIAPARRAAADILLAVERGHGHSDELLRSPQVDRLSAQDRNLATNLVMGTLRWERVLDARIAARLTRPDADMHLKVIVALRLGAFQLLFLDRIPPHAAIGESVELAKQGDNAHAAGMVNAVLRKLALEPKPDPATSAREAHPAWLLDRWTKRYGAATTTALCNYDQQPAPLALRLLHPEAEASLEREGIVLEPGEFLAQARRYVSGELHTSEALRNGWVRIQDEGSQLVAELAARQVRSQGAPRILDSCAAPGGKTAVLAERNPTAKITALDISERRLAAMRASLRTPGAEEGEENIEYRVADATMLKLAPEFDLILCDAPCSGTGTIARNPEIRTRVSEEDLYRQQHRQVAIVNSALKGLKPGGQLLYSTCSLEREENELVVESILRHQEECELLPLVGEVEAMRADGVLSESGADHLQKTGFSKGFLRTIPGVHGCDGFFAALLSK